MARLYHLSIKITAIKHPFSLSISLQKETITSAMLDFFNLNKEKNIHFLLQQFQIITGIRYFQKSFSHFFKKKFYIYHSH